MQDANGPFTKQQALFVAKGLVQDRKPGEDVIITAPSRSYEQLIVIWMLESKGLIARLLFNAERHVKPDRAEMYDELTRPIFPPHGGMITRLYPVYSQLIVTIPPGVTLEKMLVSYLHDGNFRFRLLAPREVKIYQQDSPERDELVAQLVQSGRITMM